METLPRDLQRALLSFLPPSELCSAATVNKQWADFARDETLWKDHYTQ